MNSLSYNITKVSFTYQFYLRFKKLILGPQMNLSLIHNQLKGHLSPSTHSQWISNSTSIGRDCLTMPYFLKV